LFPTLQRWRSACACALPFSDHDREYAVDLKHLAAFLAATQDETAAALQLDTDGPAQRKFLAQLQGEITRRGVIDVLRKGTALFTDDAQLFKQFQDNESFRHWLTSTVFEMTYEK
jgi:hypothetical protein